MKTAEIVSVAFLMLVAWGVETASAQGFAPRGRVYDYGVLADSTIVTHRFAASFSDSTIYAGVDSFVVRRVDVIRSEWSRSYQDSLVQWFRNSDPLDPVRNEVQLVGFSRPGLRVFYEPPLPWIGSLEQLSAGDSTWTWEGRVWPPTGTGLPDSLTFTAGPMDSVVVFDGGKLTGWPIRVEESPSIVMASGVRVDLGGRRVDARRDRVFSPALSWYGAHNDGDFHWLLLRSDQVVLLPQRATPHRRESMGSWRANYRNRQN